MTCFCTGACRTGGGCAANRGSWVPGGPPVTNSYICRHCGQWVGNMQVHNCQGKYYPIHPVIPSPTKQGWVCPQCGAVMAPIQLTCVNCKGTKVTITLLTETDSG